MQYHIIEQTLLPLARGLTLKPCADTSTKDEEAFRPISFVAPVQRETSPGAGMLQRPRGSCWGEFWTGSRCFWPTWQHWGFLWHPGRPSASTLVWWQEGSQMLSCGLSMCKKKKSKHLFWCHHAVWSYSDFPNHWPVWFVPRRALWQRIQNERWLPHDRQHLITVRWATKKSKYARGQKYYYSSRCWSTDLWQRHQEERRD